MTWAIVAVLVLATVGFVAQGFGAIRAQRDIEVADRWPRVPSDARRLHGEFALLNAVDGGPS